MALSLDELNSRINGDAIAAPQRSLERVTSPVIYDKELKLGEYGANTPYSSLGNLNDFKAANQGWAWTLANGAVQGVANAALTTAQSIPTLGYTIASPFIAANDADKSWKEVMLDYLDSPAYQGFEEAKESIRNFSPVYRGSGFNLSEFIGSNVENLLTTVSLFVPAWAAARGATAAARAIGISSGLESSLFQLSNTASRFGKASVAAVTSRHLESLMEAGQAGESTYQEYLSMHPGDTEGAEKAKRAAMGATYSWNMPALAMDLAQFYMGIPGFNFANRAVEKGLLKELIFQGASEAGEEAAQFIVSEEGKRLGLGDDSPMSEMDFLHRLGKYVQDPHFIESAALGAIGGQIFTALQHYSNKFDKSYQAASKAWSAQQSKIKDYMDGKANNSATLLQHGDIDNDTFTNTLVQAAEFGHIGFPKQAIQDLLKQDEASLKTQFGADTQPTLFGKKATPHEVLNYRASQVEQFEKAYNDTKNTYGARTQEFQNSVLAHKLNANYYQDRTKALASQAMELESDLTTRWSSILTPEALSKAKAVSEVAAISKALAYANAQPKTDFWKKKTIELLNQKNALEAAASTPEDISYFPIDELATAKANEKLSKITHDSIQDNLATLTNPKTTKQAEAVIQKEVKQEADAQKSTKLVELEEALDTKLAEITADAFTGDRISGIDAAVNDAIAQLDALKIGDTSIHKVIRQKGADAKALAKQKARGTTTPTPNTNTALTIKATLESLENIPTHPDFTPSELLKKHWQTRKDLLANKIKQLRELLDKGIKTAEDVLRANNLLNDIRGTLNEGIPPLAPLIKEVEALVKSLARQIETTISTEAVQAYIQLMDSKLKSRGLSVANDLVKYQGENLFTVDGKNVEYFITPDKLPTNITPADTNDDDNVTKDPTEEELKKASTQLHFDRIKSESSAILATELTGVLSDKDGNVGQDPRDTNGAVSRNADFYNYAPELFDYKELPTGTELTIVLDTNVEHQRKLLQEKGINYTGGMETWDPSHISYSVQIAGRPNSPIHIHTLTNRIETVKKHKENQIDPNIQKYIWEDKDSIGQQKEQEQILVAIREALYQQLIVNKAPAVTTTITAVSDGKLTKNIALQASTNVFTTTEGTVKDIEFGLLTNSGATSFNPEYEEKYANDNTTPKEWVGALVAFIPSFRKSLSTGWKIFHIKTLLSRNTISSTDALSLAKVIKQYKELLNQFQANKTDNPVAKLGIYKSNKLISHPKDLINLFIHAGETGAIDLVFDNNTLFLGPWPNALNVDTATVQDIATRLEGYKYNFVKGVTTYPELTFNADGKLLKGTTVNYKEHIIKNTKTIVSVGQPLSDNRRQYTVQPKIYFDTQFAPVETKTTSDIEAKKADIEKRRQEELNIFPESEVKETVFHNTTENFDEFKAGKDGAIHFGDKEAARQRTKNSLGDKNTIEAKINIENLVEGVDSLDFDPPTSATKEEKDIYFKLLKKADNETKEHTIALYKNGKITLEQANQLIDENWSLEKIYKELFNADGYFYVNQAENKGSKSYVVFNSNQVKIVNKINAKYDAELAALKTNKVTPAPQTTQTPPPTPTLPKEKLVQFWKDNEVALSNDKWRNVASKPYAKEVAEAAAKEGKKPITWLREQLGTAFEPTYGESPNGYRLKEELLSLEGDIFQQLFERYVAPLEGEIAQDGLRAYQVLKNRGIKVVFDNIKEPAKVVGDSLIINPNKLSQVTRAFPYILIHEALHLVGNNALVNPKTAAERQYKHRVTKAFLQTKQALGKKYPYAFKNLQEFMSEARSNPELREDLKRTKYAGSNVFEKLWLWLKDLLGFSTNIDQYLTTTLEEFLKSPNRPNEITANYYEAPIDPFLVNQLIEGMTSVAVQRLYSTKKASKVKIFQEVLDHYRNLDRSYIGTQEAEDALNEMLKANGDNEFYRYLVERAWAEVKNQATFIKQDVVEDVDLEDLSSEFEEGDRGLGLREEVFSTNPKESASKRMRALLARIPAVDEQSEPEYDAFGMRVMIPIDKVYDTLSLNLADVPSQHIMERLEQLKTPTIKQVHSVLNMLLTDKRMELDEIGLALAKEDRNNMYNEFIVNFARQLGKFITVRTDKTDVIDANSANAYRLVIQGWNDKFLTTPLVKKQKGTFTLDKEAAEKSYNLYKEAKKQSNLGPKFEKLAYDQMINSFKNFGIELNGEAILQTYTGPNSLPPKASPLYEKGFGGTVNRLNTILDQFYTDFIKTPETTLQSNANPFVNQQERLEKLARLQLSVSDNIYTAMWRSGTNKNRYAINQNSLESHIMQEISNPEYNQERIATYEKSPFSQNSLWLKMLKENPKAIQMFYNADFGETGEWKEYKNLTPTDKLIAQTVMFANPTRQGKQRPTAYIEMMPHEAKTTIITMQVPKLEYGSKGVLSSEMLDAFYSLITSEAKMIILANQRLSNGDTTYRNYDYTENGKGEKDYSKGARKKFQMFPYLNDSILPFVNTLTDVQDLDSKRDAINALIQQNFTQEYQEFQKRFSDLGLLKDGRLQFSVGLEDNSELLPNQLANYMLAAGNYMQLFTNDMAFSKPDKFGSSITDFFKRTAMQIAPGVDNIRKDNLRLTTLKDHYAPSALLGNYSVHLEKMYSSLTKDKKEVKELVKRSLEGMTNINNTDAQGYVTLDEYERLLQGWGRLNSEMTELLKKAKSKALSSTEVANFVAQPLKPVITTDIWDGKVLVRQYIKLSVIPLLPQFVDGNPLLEDIADNLNKENTGWAVYDSAHKLGATNSINITEDITDILEIPYKGVRLQQEVPYDADYKEVSTVSQARKLIFQDLLHPMFKDAKYIVDGKPWEKSIKDLKKHYDALYIANLEEALDKFKTDYGIDLTGDKAEITDIAKLNQLLIEETSKRGYSENMQKALQLDSTGTKFTIPLWITPNSVEFEGLLFSIISKNIIKQKRTGQSYVQASSFGMANNFRSIVHVDELNTKDLSKELAEKVELAKSNQALLGAYINAQGLLTGGQILIPNPFSKQLGRNITFLEAKEAGLLDMFAMRIPNQGHSSMEKVEVAGFLPPTMGDVVIVHPEILAQMGSDFDVDKLYVYYYNVEDYQGKARKIPYLTNPEEAYNTKYSKWKELNTEEATLIEEAKKLHEDTPYEGVGAILDLLAEDSEAEEQEASRKDTLERLRWVRKQKQKLQNALQFSTTIPTEEQFKTLPTERQNTKLARDNRMLDVEKSIYSIPQMLMKLTSGNTVEPYTDSLLWFYDADSIDEVRKKVGGELNPISPNTHNTLWEVNQASKAGIAWASLWSTAYSQFQYTDGLKLRVIGEYDGPAGSKAINIENVGIKVISEYNEGAPTIPTDVNAEFPQQGFTHPEFGLSTFGVVEAQDTQDQLTLLSKGFEVYMSIQVDDPKNQIAALGNLNEETLQLDLYTTGVGISSWNFKTALRLQPIIKEYVKAVKILKSSQAGFADGERHIESRAFNNIQLRFENELKRLLPPEQRELSLKNPRDIRALEASLLKQWGNTDYNTLSDVDKITWINQQLDVLHAYRYYFMKAVGTRKAPGLSKLIVALNVDTKGLPMNWLLTSKKVHGYDQALDNPDYEDVQETLNQTTYGPILNILKKSLYPYTTGNAILPYQQQLFSLLDPALAEEQLKERTSAIYAYMTSNINTGLYPQDIEAYRARLMGLTSEPSLFERIQKFRETPAGAKFLILQRVTSNPNEESFTPVEINRNTIEKSTYDYLISNLITMLKSTNQETQQLAKDMIAYSFLTKGITISPKGFSHLIPINALTTQYADFFRENPTFFDEHVQKLTQQFYQHNPKRATWKPELQKFKFNITSFETNKFSDPFVRTVKNKIPMLFQFVEDKGGKSYYRRLNLLGYKGIMEYNSNIDKWTSVFKDNNVPGNDTPAVMPVQTDTVWTEESMEGMSKEIDKQEATLSPTEIYLQLGTKTESGNVVIKGVYQQEGIKYAKSINGIFSLRVNNSEKHFGNPFSSVPAEIAKGLTATTSTKESVVEYINWVINSQDNRAKWIRELLQTGELKNKPIVYYKELREPSHATALDYLINRYNWTTATPSYTPPTQQHPTVTVVEQVGTPASIYSQLGDKTASGNVVIKSVYQQEGVQYAKSINGVFSLRVNNSTKHFGNPFSSVPAEIAKGLVATKSTKESVESYIEWITTSKWDGELSKEMNERREWIRSVLQSGTLKEKPIVYYKELGEPSHATALDYLINKYDWGKAESTAPTQVKTETIELRGGRKITFNQEQQVAINAIQDWMPTDNREFVLEGFAGTGKTTLVSTILEKNKGRLIAISAPTHKAGQVLMAKTGRKYETIQSLLGLAPNTDVENFNINALKFDPQNPPTLGNYEIVVVDEASMIGKKLFEYIEKLSEKTGTKMLYVGDRAQLPPVGEIISPVFQITTRAQLTTIERAAADNPMLQIATIIRENQDKATDQFKYEDRVLPNGDGVRFSPGLAAFTKPIREIFSSEEYKQDRTIAKVITYTNASVSEWNDKLRQIVVPTANEVIVKGDTMMGYKTVGSKTNPILFNGLEYEVTSVVKHTSAEGIDMLLVGAKYRVGSKYNNVEIPVVAPEQTNLKKFIDVQSKLLNTAIQFKGKAWVAYYKFKENHILFKDVFDDKGKLVLSKDLDYGYSLTVHKSQGSEYSSVFIDWGNLNRDRSTIERNKLKYTALTRTSKKAYIYVPGNADQGDVLEGQITETGFVPTKGAEMLARLKQLPDLNNKLTDC